MSNLKQIRKQHKLSARQIADMIGVSQPAVSRAENGDTTAIGKEKWYWLSTYFGCSPIWLEGIAHNGVQSNPS